MAPSEYIHLLPTSTSQIVFPALAFYCLCETPFLDSSHKHLYRFLKTVVTEERSLPPPPLFTQIQNKRLFAGVLPVIDMWACFFQIIDWKKRAFEIYF